MSLTPQKYRPRLIDERVKNALRVFGAVYLRGPKWCGKTWVALNAANSSFLIGDSNDYGQSNKELAEMNIRIVLDGDKPRLIDEWQDVPRTWDAVRSEVDRNPSKGQFILTGSSTPKKQKPVHSGTGRIAPISLRTMSLWEMNESDGAVSLSDLISCADIGISKQSVSLDHLIDLVLGGGWPGTLDLSPDDRSSAVIAYLEQVLEDAYSLDNIRRNREGLRMTFRSLARNECTLASVSKICSDTGILATDMKNLVLDSESERSNPSVSYDTVTDYLDVFDRLHLIKNQPAFDPNMKSSVRVGKVCKRHLVDPSLALAALHAGHERLKDDLVSFGYYFEAMCERDLDIYSESLGGKLYHYRDDSGMEVDAIVELPDGRWGAFEVKLGAHKIDQAAKDLLRFKEKLEKKGAKSLPGCLCVICGLTEYSYVRDDGVYVVSITSLKP